MAARLEKPPLAMTANSEGWKGAAFDHSLACPVL